MNDFSKEELEDIYEWGNIYCADMPTISKMHHGNLLGKIESMIDNYCEHLERVSSSDADGDRVVQCGRCDFVLWHEKD